MTTAECPLLELKPELRNEIWSLVICGHYEDISRYEYSPPKRLALTKICCQVYQETRVIFQDQWLLWWKSAQRLEYSATLGERVDMDEGFVENSNRSLLNFCLFC